MEASSRQTNFIARVWRFYRDGFRQMTVGRYLWALILVKLVVLFLVFRLFLLPDRLSRDYRSDDERSRAVRHDLITPASDDSAPFQLDETH